jgi:Protein of unknown function (DUF2845)
MKLVAIAVFCLFSLGSAAFAYDSVSTVRCKDGMISVGSSQMEVLSSCGNPLTKNRITQTSGRPDGYYSGYRGREITTELEEWAYNFGKGDFLYTFQFEGSTVKRILRGSRGF